MDYQQEYIKHEYVELNLPPGRDDKGEPTFLLDPNYLHIWPRHSFMLVALPNKVIRFSFCRRVTHDTRSQDKSFTCTLFAPTLDLDRLCSADTILAWFKTYFPDALHMIGEKTLVGDFTRNPRSPLICTKVIFSITRRMETEFDKGAFLAVQALPLQGSRYHPGRCRPLHGSVFWSRVELRPRRR
jgi:kynurenine 3-monooxygenase